MNKNIYDLTDDYYRDHESHAKEKVGFTLTFSIRNYSKQTAYLLHRGGFDVCVPTIRYERNYDYHPIERGLQLDISFGLGDVSKINFIEGSKNYSPIDKKIIELIKIKIEDNKNTPVYFIDGLTEFRFSINLNELEPDYHSYGHTSDLLGIIIKTVNDGNHGYYSDIPETCGAVVVANNDHLFNPLTTTFQCFKLIDNQGVSHPLWTMQCGEPVKIITVKNNKLDSGLYIFNNATEGVEDKHKFIPLKELNEDCLSSIGLAWSKKELIEGTKTKEFYTLKKENDKLNSLLKEEKAKYEKLQYEYSELKKDLDANKRDYQYLKTVNESLRFDLNRAKSETKSKTDVRVDKLFDGIFGIIFGKLKSLI